MAKIIGESDCTGNIKFNFQRYGIKKVKSFDEIQVHFIQKVNILNRG